MTKAAKPFSAGDKLIYYNKWTNWDSGEVREGIEQLTFEEVSALSVGDLVWLDTDPLHPNGKVYGSILRRVTQVEKIDDDTVKVFHSYGMTTVNRNTGSKLTRLKDSQAMAAFVAANPLAKQVRIAL